MQHFFATCEISSAFVMGGEHYMLGESVCFCIVIT